MIDMFSLRQLAAVVETLYPLRTPIIDLFFKEQKVSYSEYIDIDFVAGTRKLAPFVGWQMQGKQVNKKGFETRSVQPPYIKIKDVTTAQDILKRMAGQTIYSNGMNPQKRARLELTKQLKKFQDMIMRRMEYMAHEALTTQGAITYTGDGITLSVDFNMKSSHKVALAGTAKWSDTTNAKPSKDLQDWATLIRKDSGLVPNIALLDIDAARLYVDHPNTKNELDTRRVELGMINPKDMPNGLKYIGYDKMSGLEIYSYSEYYETDADVVTPIMTTKTAIIGSQSAKTIKHFGAIRDLDAAYPTQFFAKSWKENDPSAQILLLQSAPLLAPHQIDAFVSATVA